MGGLKIYYTGELLGTIDFDEEEKQMRFNTDKVRGIVQSLRESHFSSITPDEEIYDELPRLLRGRYYCQGDD